MPEGTDPPLDPPGRERFEQAERPIDLPHPTQSLAQQIAAYRPLSYS